MCGIAGLSSYDLNHPVDKAALIRMQEALIHRGPDGRGIHVEQGVGLAHTRLSVIDLQCGAQPLSNEDGTVWITFNGEIYNYRELRKTLIEAGHLFRTNSDTEVIVHGYEQWGMQVVNRLNGMFAFAIYDSTKKKLILARDHLGIKPLFYSVTNNGLAFGSEIKAVLAGTGMRGEMDPEALAEYLAFRYTARPRTFFRNVQSIPAGCLAVWKQGKLSIQQYWAPYNVQENEAISDVEGVSELSNLLKRSVEMQMVSDVALGSFCSGGIDSGLVTTYAANQAQHQMYSFSVSFQDRKWDETPLALGTANSAGTRHITAAAHPGDFSQILRSLIWHNDEPLSHPNSVPIYLLSKLARSYVTVVLTGEGADELFAGYPRYHIARFLWARTGQFFCGLPRGAKYMLASLMNLQPSQRCRRIADLLPMPSSDAMIFNSMYCDPNLVHQLTGIRVEDTLGHRQHVLEASLVPGNPIATISRYEMSTYLGCALDRMDRMAMANGLESRTPFLDVPLVEWGLQLPAKLKMRGTTTKYVLKEAATNVLSDQIVHGRKSGFGVPLNDWFRGPYFAPLLERLENKHHPAAQHFNQDTLRLILKDHKSRVTNYGEILWLLSNVYVWSELQEGILQE